MRYLLLLSLLALAGCRLPDRPTRAVVRVEVNASPIATTVHVDSELEVK